jgi:hypothetical protein
MINVTGAVYLPATPDLPLFTKVCHEVDITLLPWCARAVAAINTPSPPRTIDHASVRNSKPVPLYPPRCAALRRGGRLLH